MTIIHHDPTNDVITNKNVQWLSYPAIWAFYISLLLCLWLAVSVVFKDSGLAWTYVHLIHGVISYYLLHWQKGSAVFDDQGKYDYLTIWEQLDNGTYATWNRKLLAVVPLVLFVFAIHSADFRRQPLGANLVVVLVLLIAKLPILHRVRFFGINRW
jgi:hypothetical protein